MPRQVRQDTRRASDTSDTRALRAIAPPRRDARERIEAWHRARRCRDRIRDLVERLDRTPSEPAMRRMAMKLLQQAEGEVLRCEERLFAGLDQ